ncbi:hypothetical protein DWY25_08920 [Holdemania filiformis]|uniref:Uncharacterized protein n=1 Tax=Holdemania filiformis TaxID=61171 RepID=A0A412G183_9FIRM|nr:hypothetical protein DWY25_08920 [Holdemania filiformis]
MAESFLYHPRRPTLARSGRERTVAADEFPALSERGHGAIRELRWYHAVKASLDRALFLWNASQGKELENRKRRN